MSSATTTTVKKEDSCIRIASKNGNQQSCHALDLVEELVLGLKNKGYKICGLKRGESFFKFLCNTIHVMSILCVLCLPILGNEKKHEKLCSRTRRAREKERTGWP